ncbi:MAG: leucyl aminopeptidase [Pseudomonadota bacterium]
MDYFTTTAKPSRRAVDCVIVGIYTRNRLGAGAEDIDRASRGRLTKLMKSGDVNGEPGSVTILRDLDGVSAPRVAVVGLGSAAKLDIRGFRRALNAVMRALGKTRCSSLLSTLNLEDVPGGSAYYLARYTAETAGDALYRFHEMKSGRKPRGMPLKKLGFAIAARGDAAKTLRGGEHADAIVMGKNLARDLGNLPPNVCTPSYLARQAQQLAKKYKNLTSRALNETEMKRLGMHSLLSVTAGTAEPAKLIVMQYKGAGSEAPVVLVGKGVTFDSGGISLKPGPAMDEMKYDMCGAAGVMGTMLSVAALKLPVNLNVVIPAVENLPGSHATVPGDIVTSMSGQTIEILNTDAEGRLILCDALTYARRFKPSKIIDVATLTGACVIALGHHHTGVMSHDEELAEEILAAGRAADDRGWPLPLTQDYSDQLKSNFADFANIGGRDGGAITAGCFLAKFTDDLNWAHLDIAGTAWKSGAAKGATGRPVPMLTELLLEAAGELPRS